MVISKPYKSNRLWVRSFHSVFWLNLVQSHPGLRGDFGPVHIYVLGTQPRQNVLGTCSRYTSVHITSTVKCSRYPFVQVENGTHLGLRSMTYMYCVYTAQRVRSFWCALSVLIAVCVLSPAHLEHCSWYTSVHTCFGCVLRGRFVPRTWFDHVPAGTVLAGTILFRTRSDYKKWCVPRTCSENMFPLELYREQVWTPGLDTQTYMFLQSTIFYCFKDSNIYLPGTYITLSLD